MVSPKQLRTIVESALLGPTPPSPSDRVELLHAIRHSTSALQNLLSYPPPKPADRSQVQSKEVRLPDSPPISLDDQDVQMAIKLSDDLHLNEIECVRLLVCSNQECGILGRDPLEIIRLTAGLWYAERRDLLTAIYTLFRAVVLDQGLEADIVAELQRYLENLINTGLRQRFISLIKELNREDSTGLGGPSSERYVLDSRGALVERRAVVSRERHTLGHCLILSDLVVRTSSKDIKDIFLILKDSTGEPIGSNSSIDNQIIYSLLFSLVIALTSDALSAAADNASVLSCDASFKREFQETVMRVNNDPVVDGFVGCVRLAWVVHLLLTQDGYDPKDAASTSSPYELREMYACLDSIFANNVFQFFLDKVLRTTAYQNDDEDIVYVYNAYLHKLISCFLSDPLARDKVKETKEKAMSKLNTYRTAPSHEIMSGGNSNFQQNSEMSHPFVSLLEFVSEIYQREPELLSGNDVLWTFVNFAGEDHTNVQTLVAFLKLLSTLACTYEGASRVYELLRGKTFRSIGWSTLFDCLSIYEDKFKQSLQSPGAILPEFQEGDAQALVAYLNVLQKVIEFGNPNERKDWFPDIEPLFKLLSYENVPPYLKGALRNSITTFVQVSPVLKDTIWSFLEQYDLPVVVGSHVGKNSQAMTTQVYDMRYELNEIEARREQYPSTISFINLLNVLIAEEGDVSDRGHRFIGIYRFIYNDVFGPFPQRAYADPCEKWQLVAACLKHFHMILSMYDLKDDDVDHIADQSHSIMQPAPVQMQLPVIELMKDFMSGKTVFRNIMSILLPGVNYTIEERTNQIYGNFLEMAVRYSLEILILVFDKDLMVSDFWRPVYQPLDVVLTHDHNQIVALLEYVRYDIEPQIQQCAIKIMSILSSRMDGLAQLLLKSNAAASMIEDYASCLEVRSEESQIIEDSSKDTGVLIMQLLIDNVNRPAPNVTHLLLKFDLDSPVERTLLQPKFHFSCLKVILDMLESLSKPEAHALLYEFGLQLLYELCVDPLTSGPMMDLLSTKKYHCFVKHLDAIGTALLPKRNRNQGLRISSLHQRAWLLKLLAVELHAADITSPSHRETCQNILSQLFSQNLNDYSADQGITSISDTTNRILAKSKILELLDVVQFKSPDISQKASQVVASMKYGHLAEDILSNPSTSGKGGIYYYSERGDRLIDLAAFRDKLWQGIAFTSEAELNEARESVQQLLRWGWKYNKNLEEQASQLHMLTGWSHVAEVSASRRIAFLQNTPEILFKLLDASLSASGSPDCSLKMALILTQVGLTCMAKLRDERFMCPTGLNSDTVTSLDLLLARQLSNGACHTILFKLVLAILRQESSEGLRRRQYALFLGYCQYCQHIVDPDVPATVLQFLSGDGEESEDVDLRKIDKDQAELSLANFSILRKEAQPFLDVVIKDVTHGSESGKTMSINVLDALIHIDHEKYFLNQLQSRGFLRSCLVSISNFNYLDGGLSLESMQRICTLEAELAFMLRISHKYGKSGAQVLFSMGALEHIGSCKALNMQLKGSFMRHGNRFSRDKPLNVDVKRMVTAPILRLALSLTSLVDTSQFFEVKNKVVREVVQFVKGHQLTFDQILGEEFSVADELIMELTNLAVSILSKVWSYEESDEHGFIQSLFGMMQILFSSDPDCFVSTLSTRFLEIQRKAELSTSRLCFSLSSYLYFLITKKSLRLPIADNPMGFHASTGEQQPTLTLLGFFLESMATSLERAAEEKYLLLSKIRDINELSRQEVDEIITLCSREGNVLSSEDIEKRRYIAMVEMCQIVGDRNRLTMLLLLLAENIMNVILVHFQDSHSVKTIPYGTKHEQDNLTLLCGKLVRTLERLELLSEEKIGRNLKVFRRLVTSLKELAYHKLAV
ncbi:hypothetical protein LIER_09706 [Lithospermum erythrorhizon]|uniref:Nuclear pore complex protein NUP205 n=1 Tax=Lithospermum erythrorhizon TaxID=34254 RepID=A0AAV3PKX9_LITER